MKKHIAVICFVIAGCNIIFWIAEFFGHHFALQELKINSDEWFKHYEQIFVCMMGVVATHIPIGIGAALLNVRYRPFG